MQLNFFKPEFYNELGDTDYRYIYRVLNGIVLEEDCSLANEEVVRRLMGLANGISYCVEQKEIGSIGQLGILDCVIEEKDIQQRPALEYYWDRKTVSSAILEMRDVPLDDRILFLGMTYDRMQQFEMAGEPERIREYADHVLKEYENADIRKMFGQVKGNKKLSRLTSIMFFEMLIGGTKEQETFKKRVFKTMGVTCKVVFPPDGSVNKQYAYLDKAYEAGVDNLKCFLKGREYILENLMVQWNSLIELRFVKGKRGIWQTYMFLVCVYLVTPFMIAGCLDKELKDEDFAAAVSKGCGWILENDGAFDLIVSSMIERECTTLAHLAYLLKG